MTGDKGIKFTLVSILTRVGPGPWRSEQGCSSPSNGNACFHELACDIGHRGCSRCLSPAAKVVLGEVSAAVEND
jgi:hypothetical protein